jgi:CRP-like cAMP-binding protein
MSYWGGIMRKTSNRVLFNHYIEKYGIDNIFDKEILDHAQLLEYQKGELVLEAGTELEYLYLLVEGKVKVYYLFENGKSMFLKLYHGFQMLGDVEFLKDIPVLCHIEAVKDSQVIAIPADFLRKAYHDNANFMRYLSETLSEKLYVTINNSSYNYVYPLVNRLSSYLLESMTEQDQIVIHTTYEEIAQFLGTTYRHLNRTIKELESKSIIRCDDKIIYVLDKKKLRDLAKNILIQP